MDFEASSSLPSSANPQLLDSSSKATHLSWDINLWFGDAQLRGELFQLKRYNWQSSPTPI